MQAPRTVCTMHRCRELWAVAGAVLLVGWPGTRADNPLVPAVGMADPHIHVFDGKVRLQKCSATHSHHRLPLTALLPDDPLSFHLLSCSQHTTHARLSFDSDCWSPHRSPLDLGQAILLEMKLLWSSFHAPPSPFCYVPASVRARGAHRRVTAWPRSRCGCTRGGTSRRI
jgi:hypothetical protein